MMNDKDRQLREVQFTSQRQLHEMQRTLEHSQHGMAVKDQEMERKERELQKTRELLQASQQLVLEFQESLQQKDETITELQRTISEHERKIQQKEQRDTASTHTIPQQEPVATPQTTVAAAQKDISKMRWREGTNAPQLMARGAAVLQGSKAYFSPADSRNIYAYKRFLGGGQWFQLPDNPSKRFCLAVVYGLLTGVGSWNNGSTNILLSLTGEVGRKQWSQIFPPMPTPRINAACVTTERALVVAGGYGAGYLDTVEVMNTDTKVWTKVVSLPKQCTLLTATVFGDRLYFGGGVTAFFSPSKSLFTCSLPHLWASSTKVSDTVSLRQNVWKKISSLPVTQSTLVSFGGHLLAIGGRDDADNPTSHVYRYDSHTDSWATASQMKNKRSYCFAVTFPGDHLIIVGGCTVKRGTVSYSETQSAEIFE